MERIAIGSRWKLEEFGGEYILAMASAGSVFLVNLSDGNRWSEPVPAKVEGWSISVEDWKAVQWGSRFLPSVPDPGPDQQVEILNQMEGGS